MFLTIHSYRKLEQNELEDFLKTQHINKHHLLAWCPIKPFKGRNLEIFQYVVSTTDNTDRIVVNNFMTSHLDIFVNRIDI